MALTEERRNASPTVYDPGDFYDEAFSVPGAPRAHYVELMSALQGVEPAALAQAVTDHVATRGCAFGAGEDAEPFVIDPVPRLITATEWDDLEAGLAQRLRALDAFVADIYGGQRIVTDGALPERVLAGVSYFEPDAVDIPPAPGPRIAVAGLDVIRDRTGCFRVLEDNVRTPSGMAYALAARRAVGEHLPWDGQPREIAPAIEELLRAALMAARPDPEGDGAVVLLTDGPANTAFWEHEQLAAMVGIPLVVPGDLRVAGDQLVLRADGRPVQAAYRRLNVDRLREPDGQLTEMGELLLGPLRAGTFAVVNAFGTGVADDKVVYPYVERMIRFYLGEEPLARSVQTYDLEDRDQRDEALGRLDELVVKPRDGFGGQDVLIGPHAERQDLHQAAQAIRMRPQDWVAQETVFFSTHPTVVGDELVPRHVDLRPFVFFDGERAAALPGGLTRVALGENELVVNSSRGGGAKDTWVLL